MAIITGTSSELSVYLAPDETVTEGWLVLVVDETTYSGLNGITISGTDGPSSISESDSWSDPVTSGRIPVAVDTHFVGPETYPGCENPATNYQVSAVISQMQQIYPDVTSVRYILVYAFDSVTNTPQTFSIEVDSTRVNMLVLAQGVEGDSLVLNENSPFSGSTLVIPEVAPIFLGVAAFGAFGVFLLTTRKSMLHDPL
jgi:hypothetical protein